MIKRFIFGSPLETGAVVKELQASNEKLPFFTLSKDLITWTMELGKEDIVYGLGEQVRGINKRGWKYISDCTDDPNHTEGKHSLYGAHNFLLIDGHVRFGVFFDTPSKVVFDIGYTKTNELSVSFDELGVNCYMIEGDNNLEIIKEFRTLIGQSYIPPKWAFGYGQSRWSYMNEEEVREVVKRHRENGIPLDSVYLDIDYMESYKDFTISEERFPYFPKFVEEMKKQNIHLVPIIDAGVKIEEGYDIYEEGKKQGYFCKDSNGEDFVAAVWPGKVHFPDFLNEEARRWFGSKYKILIDMGIEGFWNDMNEPAIFYSEKHLNEVFEKIDDYKGKNLDIRSFFAFQGMIQGINNRKEDYESFYHNYQGKMIRHDKLHNLYGYNMTRAAGEAFEGWNNNKRMLMFSRASYIGMHRYGGIWTGDNQSFWSHLEMNIKMMPSLNMCGFLYSGADIGGFGADTTPDLLLRWLAFSIFTPLMRNHSAEHTRRQEAYRFENIESYRNMIGLRYAFLPYIYSEFMKAALNNEMYIKPLSFEYPNDKRASRIEDQLLIGNSIMIAPVYKQNATGRYVYLPEEMKMYRMRSVNDMDIETLSAGDHYIEVDLNEVLIFIRPDCIVPFAKGAQCVMEVDYTDLRILDNIKHEAKYLLYNDDGYEKKYNDEGNWIEIVANSHRAIRLTGKMNISCSLD